MAATDQSSDRERTVPATIGEGADGPLRFLFLATDGTHLPPLKSLCSQTPGLTGSFATAPAHEHAAIVAEHAHVHAVVLVACEHSDDVLAHIPRLAPAETGHGPNLVVAAANLQQNQMVELLRRGVADFLPLPCGQDDLAGLVAATRKQADAVANTKAISQADTSANALAVNATDHGQVLAFAHALGGAGASTLAVNCAASLTHTHPDLSVAVLDLDIQYGVLASLLDVQPRAGISDILATPQRLDEQMLRDLMVEHASGIQVLTAPPQPVPLDALSPDTAQSLIATARRVYDVVIVDLPSSLAQWTSPVLDAADVTYLVTLADVPSIHGLSRLLGCLQSEGLDDDTVHLVANRLNPRGHQDEGPSLAQISRAVGRRVEHSLPDHASARAAANTGMPVCLKPTGRYAQGVRTLLDATVSLAGPGDKQQTPLARLTAGTRLGRLLGR